MRLIRTSVLGIETFRITDFSLIEFDSNTVPPVYAILSHRWVPEEVTLQDLIVGNAKQKVGYQKLEFCAKQAAKDGISYFWIDTCCIDRSNYVELSEAIHSMYSWYERASKCYVYMADVSSESGEQDTAFRHSAWFTRGWTLQELIAPHSVEFFSREGQRIGDKFSLMQEVNHITGVPVSVLGGQSIHSFSVEERFSWAAGRVTTIEEDRAYALMGIFDVHIPIRYGEGGITAMNRLRNALPKSLPIHQHLLQSLRTTAYEAHKNRNPRLPATGTCQWVLSHQHFLDWRSGKGNPLLWISADPGCGKSVLCRHLVDQVLCHDAQTRLSYFFFKDNSEQDSLATALCAILHQLLTEEPLLIRHAMPIWERYGANLQHETHELWKVLRACASDTSSGPVVCVLDGLDECQERDRNQLINLIHDLTQNQTSAHPAKLKVLATSRPHVFERSLGKNSERWPGIQLRGETETEKFHKEISAVVEQKVRELVHKYDLSTASHDHLRQLLLNEQIPNYLWLDLVMLEIQQAYANSLYPDNVETPWVPASVEDAYERLLGRIVSKKQRKNAYLILLITIGARRPLKISEMGMALRFALTQKGSAQQISPIASQRLERLIREFLGGLIFIQDSEVLLIHSTVTDFLMASSTNIPVAGERWKSSFSAAQVETEMARICISCLTLLWDDGFVEPDSFLLYCAEYWCSHLRDHMLQENDDLLHQVLKLYQNHALDRSPWFSHAWARMYPYSRPPKCSVEHLAAMFGHTTILDTLKQLQSIDLDKKDSTNRTALSWAVERNQEKAVQWLLDNGANSVARGGYYGNLLQVLSVRGHQKMLELLLDKGADVNIRGGHYGNALQAASARGHQTVAEVLLYRGAEVNARGGHYGSALQAASARGHSALVKLLLDNDAEVNARGGHYGNALQAASARGDVAIVLILLQAGADCNALEGRYGSAIQAASNRGHRTVVRMLLDAGSDADLRGGQHSNALQAASARGYDAVVRLLLENGADVNARGGHYGNALQAAAACGQETVLQLLLDHGAQVTTYGGYYGDALQAASAFGLERVVQVLLSRNANVSAQGGYYGSALHAASACGHAGVVQMLLDKGASMDIKINNRSALQLAMASHHDNVANLLLTAGADMKLKSNDLDNEFDSTLSTIFGSIASDLDIGAARSYISRLFHQDHRLIFFFSAVVDFSSLGKEGLANALCRHFRVFAHDLVNELHAERGTADREACKLILHHAGSIAIEIAHVSHRREEQNVFERFHDESKEPGQSAQIQKFLEHQQALSGSWSLAEPTDQHDSEATVKEQVEEIEQDAQSDYSSCDPISENMDNYTLTLEGLLNLFKQSDSLAKMIDALWLDAQPNLFDWESITRCWQEEMNELPPIHVSSLEEGDIHYSTSETLQLSDHIKLTLERFTGKPWDWWPFRAPTRPIPPGKVRLEWDECCGRVQRVDLSMVLAEKIKSYARVPAHVRKEFGTLLASSKEGQQKIEPPDEGSPHDTKPNEFASSQGVSSVVGPSRSGSTASKDDSEASIPSIQGADPAQPPEPEDQPRKRFVLLCVRNMSGPNSLQHNEIEIPTTMTDNEFFEAFRRQYRSMRGWFYWLHPDRFWYCHCSRFYKWDVEKISWEHNEMPSCTSYVYQPRPAADPYKLPVSRDEWEHRYHENCDLKMRSDFLARIPTRVKHFQISTCIQAHQVWGLNVEYRISAKIILLWSFVCISPGILFFILWLVEYARDLQNASVPVMFILSFVVLPVGLVTLGARFQGIQGL